MTKKRRDRVSSTVKRELSLRPAFAIAMQFARELRRMLIRTGIGRAPIGEPETADIRRNVSKLAAVAASEHSDHHGKPLLTS
jgi:hypothetical protein